MSFKTDFQKTVVQVSLILKRNLIGIVMVTYVPTVLMNIINQATNHISSESKESSKISQIDFLMCKISVWLNLHHQHHMYDGAGLCLPLCVCLTPTYSQHQASGTVAAVQLSLPILCYHSQYCFTGFTSFHLLN